MLISRKPVDHMTCVQIRAAHMHPRELHMACIRFSVTKVDVTKEIGSEQIPKSTIDIAALGKMPGSEGNHGQTAKL